MPRKRTSSDLPIADLEVEAISDTNTTAQSLVAFQFPRNDPLLETFSHILINPQKRDALWGLKNADGQLVVDYIYSVSVSSSSFGLLQGQYSSLSLQVVLRPELTIAWLRKHSIIALYKLSSASNLHPQCYVLKDITRYNKREGFGGFCDIYRGHYDGKDLCLKVVRLRKSDQDAALKVHS